MKSLNTNEIRNNTIIVVALQYLMVQSDSPVPFSYEHSETQNPKLMTDVGPSRRRDGHQIMTEVDEVIDVIEVEKSVACVPKTMRILGFPLDRVRGLVSVEPRVFDVSSFHIMTRQRFDFFLLDLKAMNFINFVEFTGFLSTFFKGTVATFKGSFGVQFQKSSILEKGRI